MVKEIEAILCFAIFGKNSKIPNGRHFWGGENFFEIAKICLFGVLRRFQHCIGHITTGSWKGRGNQYIEFARVVYCKLSTNGKQLPAFPLEPVRGSNPSLRGGGRECYHSATVAPEIAKSTLLGYPVGRKFRRNRSVSHG